MANPRISMRKIKDVLRLRYTAGLSYRQIATSLHIGYGAVVRYLHRAEAAGLTWPLPAGMSDEELERRLFGTREPQERVTRTAPDFAMLHQELQRKGVTLQLLWEEYQASSAGPHYSYPQFCARYRAWRQTLKRSLRQVHQAGEKLFVDYCGPTVPVIDGFTGAVRGAQIFVAVLGASNYTFAEATWTQSLPDWIGSHVRALTFLGGVPQLVVPDNLKAGVTKACRYEPELNPTYAEWARHYNTAVLPARPYKPKDKAKVEVGVQIVERWILARLRHQQFFSLAELNTAIAALLTTLNQRPFKKLPGSRHSQFLTYEHPALKPLPPLPYEYADWRQARVHLDYHLEVEGHFYSVPHRFVRQAVDVRLTVSTIEVFLKGERIATHRRSARKGSHTTLAEHMPKAHQRHLEWTPGRFLNWAQTIGPATRTLVQHLLEHRAHPEQGYRSCLGLLQLAKRFTAPRLEAACQKAIALGAFTRRSVASILEHGLDQIDSPAAADESQPPLVHDNLRGPTYYQ
jgi:transposase